MARFGFAGVVTLLGITFLSPCAGALSPSADLNEQMSYDGLQKTNISGVELAYALPGATLAHYRNVLLEPVSVSFYKNWNPNVPGTPFTISANDRETIRQRSAKLVYDAFVKELQSNGGYPIVTVADADTLRVKISIINLDITAPDVATAGPSQTYVASAGQATLFAELFDGQTGSVIARVIDRKQARDTGFTNSMMNASQGRYIASNWAKILRDDLERARQATPAAGPVTATP